MDHTLDIYTHIHTHRDGHESSCTHMHTETHAPYHKHSSIHSGAGGSSECQQRTSTAGGVGAGAESRTSGEPVPARGTRAPKHHPAPQMQTHKSAYAQTLQHTHARTDLLTNRHSYHLLRVRGTRASARLGGRQAGIGPWGCNSPREPHTQHQPSLSGFLRGRGPGLGTVPPAQCSSTWGVARAHMQIHRTPPRPPNPSLRPFVCAATYVTPPTPTTWIFPPWCRLR